METTKGKHDVLISYSTKDKSVADAIVGDFEQHGIRCWYAPRDILPGEHWVTAIKNGIENAQAVVLVFTDDSNSSAQVMNEIAMAFNAGKTIIPFRLSGGEMNPELEYYLSRVHWLDAVSSSSIAQDIEKLRENVQAIVKKDEPASTPKAETAPDIQTEKAAEAESEASAEPVSAPESGVPAEPASFSAPQTSEEPEISSGQDKAQPEAEVKNDSEAKPLAVTENKAGSSSGPSGMSYEEYLALPENNEINEKINKNSLINYIVGVVGFVLFAFVLGLIVTSIIILAGTVIAFVNQKKKNYTLAIVSLVLEIPMLVSLIFTIPVMKDIKGLNDKYKAYSEG